MFKPLRRLSGLHATAECGRPAGGPDGGAAKAAGKLQPAADRRVRPHRQVRATRSHLAAHPSIQETPEYKPYNQVFSIPPVFEVQSLDSV